MPVGSASIRRASGAMNKSEKKAEKTALNVQAVLTEIEVEKINGTFGQAPQELKKSIKKYGILSPVAVIAEGDAFVLVSGKSRVSAAKELDIKQIKAVVLTLEGSGNTAAKRDILRRYSATEAEEEIAISAIHEEKFNAIKSIGTDLPSYLL